MRWVPWVAGALVLALLGYSACEGVRADRAEATRDSALAVSQVKDSVAQMEADSGRSAQNRARLMLSTVQTLTRQADSLRARLKNRPVLILPDSTPSDSVRYWHDSATVAQETADVALGLSETLQGSLDTITTAYRAQEAATAQFLAAYAEERSRANDLDAALRKMPGCRRLLGVPMPRPVVGYGVTQQGLGPFVGIGIPLGKC